MTFPVASARPAVLLLLAAALLLPGCASYDAELERGRSLRGLTRYFIVSNLNDNHALDHHLAAALRARGLQAEVGPLTMKPDDSQVILTYRDHWAWDFGDHLTYLHLAARDARSGHPIGSATFSARVPLRENASVTLNRLVGQLLAR